MCSTVTIFMPAVSRQRWPSERGFTAAACACTALVCTQMFLPPSPNCSPVDIAPGATALVLIELSGQTLSHCSVKVSWRTLVHLSSKERVEEPTRLQLHHQKQLSDIAGRASEIQKGCPGETVGAVPSKSLGGLCVAPGDAWLHSVPSCLSRWVNEGLRCFSLTFGSVGAQLAPCGFIWILGERK